MATDEYLCQVSVKFLH